jgi:hypothetical protein
MFKSFSLKRVEIIIIKLIKIAKKYLSIKRINLKKKEEIHACLGKTGF